MNKEMKKDYEKALKLYHRGELNKALKCCEEGISKNLKNNSVLNLKGLILYLKGDLEGAITVWKINKDFNEDEMSKTYIKDARNDEERQREFEKARKLIKELNINEAIESLEICTESDFNAIQVNNALALCSLKKGDYETSREYINKSMKINKCDKNTNDLKREIDNFAGVKDNKKLVNSIVLVLAILLGISAIFISIKGYKNRTNSENYVGNIDEINKPKEERTENISNNIEDIQNNEEVKKEEDNLSEVTFTADEIEKNYIEASTFYGDGKYEEAELLLSKIVKPSVGNHLNNDIMFLLASTYEKLEDKNNSIKYFEEYISTYKNGEYIEEVYYKLALLYKDIDIVKSKEYANIISYSYPKSIYNNSNIDSILAN